MPSGVPPLPPEMMWPTGDMPSEGQMAMAIENAALAATTGHEVVPSNVQVAPRDFDPAALDAERPVSLEGDALLDKLRATVGKKSNGTAQTAPRRPAFPNFAVPSSDSPDMHYAFPLSADGNRAEVNLYGQITAADIRLLVGYLQLTEKKLKNGNTASPGLPEHDSAGSDEKLPAKRHASRPNKR